MALPTSRATKIASYVLHDPQSQPGGTDISQSFHRINLLNRWSIKSGDRILELGCGQGNMTIVLAESVGDTGLVDAVDPGPPDYGSPWTLAEAQSLISKSEIGGRVHWHFAMPEQFLEMSEGQTWDVAVLAHCIWYFADPNVLSSILRTLKGRVKRVCIAEYALNASVPAAVPHVLAVLARGTLEACKVESTENVRTPIGPEVIKSTALEVGWKLGTESVLVPDKALDDGHWEAGTVVHENFLEDMDKEVKDERLKAVVKSARESTIAAVKALGGARTRTMDVWVAEFDGAS